uniref:Glycosyl transferase CAP10 domain-containing protein n=1 Tax=viral metagenome TaxID=1070528 RepID=A0A6C0CQF9_9ZZZZ
MEFNDKYPDGFFERLQFYLGEDKDKSHPDMNKYCINDLTNGINTHDTVYDVPLKYLLEITNNKDKRFSFSRGDVITKDQQHNWTISKNRCEENNSSILVRSFNINRHWGLYYNKPLDFPFETKMNAVFWRGVTTGCSQHFSAKEWNPREANRFTMIENWYEKRPDINVGFSFVHRSWLKSKYECYVKGRCRPEEFLKHKYILSIEGNDKDSGLNWKLNSNSVVLMPRPRVTSWLMESKLEANKHYVLLKDDFSDLGEKVDWCNNNQEKCKEIIRNANKYMSQFSNNYLEQVLEIEVIKKYFVLKDKLKDN